MGLPVGHVLSSYQVLGPLGAGAMGEVYRARDTRLGRDVAIKVLPEAFVDDEERLRRFEREAKALASLNHSNVAQIFGVDQVGDTCFLVLELVPGETLEERLRRAPLPIDDAIDVCRQIAEGLEAAHEAGVIHRDLKPANVRITPDGKVKVLDFGLAKPVNDGREPGSTTDSVLSTESGRLLGTPTYMAPEQARGRSIDRRVDVWAFGCVLYECLTGKRAFEGETLTDVLSSVLRSEVDLAALPASTPPRVRELVRRTLHKDPRKRLRDVGDARVELELAQESPAEGVARTGTWRAWPLVAGALVLGGLFGFLLRSSGPAATPAPVHDAGPRRYTIELPANAPLVPPSALPFSVDRPSFDLSRDGRQLVYAALVDGGTRLYLRDMEAGTFTEMPGTEGAFYPFFSPDARSVAFFANEKLLRLDIGAAERPRVLADAVSAIGAFWAEDGQIYFTPNESSAVHRVSKTGVVESVSGSARPKDSVLYDAFPYVTDDGRTLFFAPSGNTRTIDALDLASGALSTLIGDASGPRIGPGGELLFFRGDRLMAARMTEDRTALAGEPVGLVGGIRRARGSGHWALSDDGTLVYASGPTKVASRFTWVDREGRREPLGIAPGDFRGFSLSPDGKRLAVPIVETDGADVWVFELDRPQTPRRITFDGWNNHAIWSPDGRWLLFATYPGDGSSRIRAQDLESRDEPIVVHESSHQILLHQYDLAARELFFSEDGAGTLLDLKAGTLDLAAGREARLSDVRVISASPHHEVFARISPDRRWVAYNSDETGRWEVYIASYPDLAGRIRVSDAGGEEMQWTRDGSKLNYRWGAEWYEVELTIEPRLSSSQPRALFKGPFVNTPGMSWDATPDRSRFLVVEDPEQDRRATTLEVVTGFDGELRRRLAPETAR